MHTIRLVVTAISLALLSACGGGSTGTRVTVTTTSPAATQLDAANGTLSRYLGQGSTPCLFVLGGPFCRHLVWHGR